MRSIGTYLLLATCLAIAGCPSPAATTDAGSGGADTGAPREDGGRPSTSAVPDAIDWAAVAGIEGGAPSRPTVCGDLSGIDATGATDVGPAIQAALDSCPPGQTVLLGAGIFRVDGDLHMRSEITLRGAGAQTVLRPSGAIIFSAGLGRTVADLAGEAHVGDTTLTLTAPPEALTVGSTVLLNELDDPSYVHPYGYEEEATAPLHCTYCDEPDMGTRVRSQMVRITAIEGSQISIAPALYSAFTRSPRIMYPAAADTGPNVLTYAGIESFVLEPTGAAFAVRFEYAQNCWMTGV